MTKRSTQRKNIHFISGDTIAQRKQQVCRLLERLGFQIDRKEVLQTKGTLFIRFLPPFPEQFWLRLEQLSQYAAVMCIPSGERPEVERVEAVFEQEPGWYFYVPLTLTYHAMARTELQTLLPWYNQLWLARQTAAGGQSHEEEQEVVAIDQQSLWDEDTVEEGR
jgi:hypothetical protein